MCDLAARTTCKLSSSLSDVRLIYATFLPPHPLPPIPPYGMAKPSRPVTALPSLSQYSREQKPIAECLWPSRSVACKVHSIRRVGIPTKSTPFLVPNQ